MSAATALNNLSTTGENEVKKKAQDLKPGDVLPEGSAYKRSVVLQRIDSDGIDVRYALGVLGEDRSIRRWFPVADDVEVESPTLTPAQQHAEELLAYVQSVARNENFVSDARALLAKIDPPKPPSVEELFRALDSIDEDHMPPSAKKVLERARQHGYLGKDAQ